MKLPIFQLKRFLFLCFHRKVFNRSIDVSYTQVLVDETCVLWKFFSKKFAYSELTTRYNGISSTTSRLFVFEVWITALRRREDWYSRVLIKKSWKTFKFTTKKSKERRLPAETHSLWPLKTWVFVIIFFNLFWVKMSPWEVFNLHFFSKLVKIKFGTLQRSLQTLRKCHWFHLFKEEWQRRKNLRWLYQEI